ncbi:hypothetical protein LTR78_008060 [Recurvomyces mirabilis]|uniref:PCI domain-containing protein n=1 Tax=Recurvomyces mirabilis TaxID=574656 RepID=A0AAE0WJ43_9PEZI|nr:hypothetical protein LTR78_008060 [Recurvomyces mirabilis]KAK5150788.1 hypothetical protein LTS14_009851 [Recurvomyces mirabilis]
MQTAPAYTPVAARQTLQRPFMPAQPQKQAWPPAVRGYVGRAFDPESMIPGIEGPIVAERLRDVITKAAEARQLDTIDWSTYPLPQVLIKAEREQAAFHGGAIPVPANLYSLLPPPNVQAWAGQLNKRKNDEVETTLEEEDAITPPWKKKNKGNLEDRMSGKSKAQEKKQKKIILLHANGFGADSDVLAKRKQRFGMTTPEPSPYLSSRDDSPEPAGPLVGTCQTIEKSYFRLTAPPSPEVVRPFAVLEKALNHIRRKWREEHNYNFACDQLKSMRQDLTVQHIQNELTVKVYECHARIALEMKDLGEYNQCQTQLRTLYKMNLGGNPEEFIAYRILYIIYTCNRTDMNNVLADLTSADKQKPGVKHALQVRSALASGNYHRFFRLYLSAPFMGGYLLDMIIQRERLAAMAAMCRAYKPDVSLNYLAEELAFSSDDEGPEDPDATQRQCLEFLCLHGGEPFVERKEHGTVRFQTGKAMAVFEGARAAAFRGVDIKGQI